MEVLLSENWSSNIEEITKCCFRVDYWLENSIPYLIEKDCDTWQRWKQVSRLHLHLFNISSLRTCARYSSDFCKDRKIRTQEKADKVKISNRRNREMNVSVLTQILTCNKAVILETETYKPIVKMSETARVNRALCFSKAVQHMKSRKT